MKQIKSAIKACQDEQIWANQSFLSHSNTNQTFLHCTSLPKRETQTFLSKLYLNSEEKHQKQNAILVTKPKQRLNPCVYVGVCTSDLMSLFPLKSQRHTWKMPLWKHQSLKNYITHLSLHHHPTSTGCGRVQSSRYWVNIDLHEL